MKSLLRSIFAISVSGILFLGICIYGGLLVIHLRTLYVSEFFNEPPNPWLPSSLFSFYLFVGLCAGYLCAYMANRRPILHSLLLYVIVLIYFSQFEASKFNLFSAKAIGILAWSLSFATGGCLRSWQLKITRSKNRPKT